MQRLIQALINSTRAFRRLWKDEAAFREELVLLGLAVPVALVVSTTWRGYAVLIGSVLALLMVEVLNTAIEAACDAFSREFHQDIQLAKDCGSLAVLIAIVLALSVWVIAIAERLLGHAI